MSVTRTAAVHLVLLTLSSALVAMQSSHLPMHASHGTPRAATKCGATINMVCTPTAQHSLFAQHASNSTPRTAQSAHRAQYAAHRTPRTEPFAQHTLSRSPSMQPTRRASAPPPTAASRHRALCEAVSWERRACRFHRNSPRTHPGPKLTPGLG